MRALEICMSVDNPDVFVGFLIGVSITLAMGSIIYAINKMINQK